MKVGYWTLLAVAVVAVTLVPGLAWGQIITDIEMIVTEDAYGNPMLFTVEENIQEGDEVYHDRDYTITDLSEELLGLEWIKTYMNAGDLRDGDLASFTVAADATLYYVYDQRGDPGDCYADWDVTELLFDCTDDDAHWEPGSILSQSFSAGETFTMCQNEEGGSMYIIIAEPADGAACDYLDIALNHIYDWEGIDDVLPDFIEGEVTIVGTVEVGGSVLVSAPCDSFHDMAQLVNFDCTPTEQPWRTWDFDTCQDIEIPGDLLNPGGETTLTEDHFGLWAFWSNGQNYLFVLEPAGAEGEPEPEGEIDYPPPVPEGTPVAGMLGLGLVAAACALGGAMTLRKK